jgi:hypothetical protein
VTLFNCPKLEIIGTVMLVILFSVVTISCSYHFLTLVIRQGDQTFCEVKRKVSLGDIDEACVNFINALFRPLPSANGKAVTRLFSQNIMTDMYNRDAILSMPEQLYSFKSIDEGGERYHNKMLVPKTLWLKEHTNILRNLSDSLVNRLQGSAQYPRGKRRCVLSKFE